MGEANLVSRPVAATNDQGPLADPVMAVPLPQT